MNTLEITKEIKQVTFKYVADIYEFTGTCSVTVDKEIKDITAQVGLKGTNVESPSSSTHIGSCSSNGSTNVNIYNNEYKDKIDEVAHHFKTLQADLSVKYSTAIFNEEL